MNPFATFLGHSGVVQSVRAVVLLRSITAPGRHAIRPLSAVATKTHSGIGRENVSMRYLPPFCSNRLNSRVFCYSTSAISKEDSNGAKGGDENSSSNKTNDRPQSPFSSPLGGKAETTSALKSARRSPTRKKKFVPRKAAVKLTEQARILFQKLLYNQPNRDGILLDYQQSSTGQPRMVFSFRFVSKDELHKRDEGVSLEVDEEGNPKSPGDALDDGLPKLYIHHNAFLKVLGATVDVDTKTLTPVLHDKEGFELDANL